MPGQDNFDPQNVSQNLRNPDEMDPSGAMRGHDPRQFAQAFGMSGASGAQQPQMAAKPGLWQLIQGLLSGTQPQAAQAANPVQPRMQMPSQRPLTNPMTGQIQER